MYLELLLPKQPSESVADFSRRINEANRRQLKLPTSAHKTKTQMNEFGLQVQRDDSSMDSQDKRVYKSQSRKFKNLMQFTLDKAMQANQVKILARNRKRNQT